MVTVAVTPQKTSYPEAQHHREMLISPAKTQLPLLQLRWLAQV
jgi:hypothetical protein